DGARGCPDGGGPVGAAGARVRARRARARADRRRADPARGGFRGGGDAGNPRSSLRREGWRSRLSGGARARRDRGAHAGGPERRAGRARPGAGAADRNLGLRRKRRWQDDGGGEARRPARARGSVGGVCRGGRAARQARAVAAAVPLTGLIVTKLDGTAKGGSVVALERAVQVPIRFLGTGEGLGDLEVFAAERFARRLIGG